MRRPHWAGAAPAALLLMLAGCSAVPNAVSPVTWWHDLEGGEIAKDRPPPPNARAPYPHIAAAPARPAGMPDWEWAELTKTLAAKRASAQQYAAQNPIPALPAAPAASGTKPATAPASASTAATAASPASTPPQSAAAAAPPDDSAAEIARLAAAPGPAGSKAAATLPSQAIATATGHGGNTTGAGNGGTAGVTFNGPTTPATGRGPQSVPITPGSPDTGGPPVGTKYGFFDANNGLSVPGATGPIAQPDEAHPPPVPTTVPVPPAVPGFAIPTVPTTYAPPKALPQPAPYSPPPPLPDVPPVSVGFAPHSAVLTPPMQRALAKLVGARAGANLAVTGYGDATSDAIADQAAALPLALERARAIEVQLMAAGVSPSGIVTDARARGSGGLARLVD